jgi:hypothetical protein
MRAGGAGAAFDRALRFLAAVDGAFAGLDQNLNMNLLINTLYSQVIG